MNINKLHVGKSKKHAESFEVQNESVMLKISFPDFLTTSVMRFKRSDTMDVVLAKVHAKSQHEFDFNEYLMHKIQGNKEVPLKKKKTIADLHLNNNDTLIIKKEEKDKVKKRSIAIEVNRFFGKTMEDIEISETYGIPHFFEKGLQYLENNNRLETDGLFRVSGQKNVIQNYKTVLNRGEDVDFEADPLPANVAGLLKLFLRELADPLIPFHLYEKFVASAHFNEHDRVKYLTFAVTKLCQVSYALLRRFSIFLRVLAQNAAVTRMTTENLSLVIGPNILRQQNESMMDMIKDSERVNVITKCLIDYSDYIFVNETKLTEPQYEKVCQAIHNYTPNSGDELEIYEHDIIFCTKCSDDGWWHGELHDKVGLFPENYVDVIVDGNWEKPPEPEPETSSLKPEIKIPKSNRKSKEKINAKDVEEEKEDNINDIKDVEKLRMLLEQKTKENTIMQEKIQQLQDDLYYEKQTVAKYKEDYAFIYEENETLRLQLNEAYNSVYNEGDGYVEHEQYNESYTEDANYDQNYQQY